jgi:hypothetical protein
MKNLTKKQWTAAILLFPVVAPLITLGFTLALLKDAYTFGAACYVNFSCWIDE